MHRAPVRMTAIAVAICASLTSTAARADDDDDDDDDTPTAYRNVPALFAGAAMTFAGGAGVLGGFLVAATSEDQGLSQLERNGAAVALFGTTLVGAGVPLMVWGATRVPVIDPNRPLTSRVLLYREPIPAGYHVEYRASRRLILGGSLLLLCSYVIAFSLTVSDSDGRVGYIPLAGPFIASIANTGDDDISAEDERRTQLKRMAYAWTGLAQTAGVAVFAAGIHGGAVLVRDGSRPTQSSTAAWSAPTLHLGVGQVTVRWQL